LPGREDPARERSQKITVEALELWSPSEPSPKGICDCSIDVWKKTTVEADYLGAAFQDCRQYTANLAGPGQGGRALERGVW